MKRSPILVIGGAGYIGSCMLRTLKDAGHHPVVFDNFSTGRRSFVPRDVPCVKGDLKNARDVAGVFSKYRFSAVMHFAASSLVGESVEKPLQYYENNVLACVGLLKAMQKAKVRRFIFSSTAAVYGEPERVPIEEDDEKIPTNPYGRSKLMIETMLWDQARVGALEFVALRYFNACGAHESGSIGESHHPETHLIPNILKVLTGERKELVIFGDDYDTPDGTCIRDYVHIQDLCDAHLLALQALAGGMKSGVFNLGHGEGYSVRQILEAVERVTGKRVRVKIGARRAGDPARLIASPLKARQILGWTPKHGLDTIVSDAWRWESRKAKGAI